MTRYSWSCQQAGGNPVSCTNAQYKPLDPTSCNETRLPPQCIYSVKNADKSISTQDGPLTLTLASTTACRAPVDGKPRVVCTASTGTITTSLAGFTLPQAVTQKAGTCQVVFDAPDTCSPRSDTINIIPTTPQCDPQIKDDKNPAYCPRTIVNNTVCVKLADKYGNPVYNYATNTIISILGKVESNSYYGAGDTTVYTPGVFSVVGNEYCIPICVAGTCPPPVSCADTNSCPPPPSNCDPMNKTCAPVTCIKTTTETCTDPVITQPGGGICIQSVANSQCTPPGPVITQPGGGTIITRKKACTGYLEVWNGIEWTNNGDIILYDQPHTYRVVVRDTDPVCQGGSLSINTISELGGGFANSIIYSATGTFTATITKRDTDTPTSLRGIAVQAVFTQPGGITYGLTDLDTDFTDTPIQITGNRMKGVRVIGNTAGTNIGEFNLNNGWVVAEQGPITNAARSTMLQKVALLTRGITSGSLINGILYIE